MHRQGPASGACHAPRPRTHAHALRTCARQLARIATLTRSPTCPPRAAQVHIFLFVVAMTHVTTGVVMILIASLRLTAWRRWPDDELQRS